MRHYVALVGVLLPCVGLVLLGARLIEKENALDAARLLDTRVRMTTEMSQALLDQLAGIVGNEVDDRGALREPDTATAFVATLRGSRLDRASARWHAGDIDAQRVFQRLASDTATLAAMRGALGEPRVVPYDTGRVLLTLRYVDGQDARLVAVRTQPLVAAAGLTLGDSVELLASGRDHAIGLGSGIDGLWLLWRDNGAPPWRGPQRYYLASLIVIAAMGALGVLLVVRDARRESQVASVRQNFVAAVSHELRTPLTSIRVFAETLRDRALPSAARREYLDTMIDETERLSRLVDNVLEFTRIERGDRRYRMTEADIAPIVRRAVGALRQPLEQKGFQLHVDCPEQLPMVSVDSDAVEQAVLNLLVNAMKYSGDARDIAVEVASTAGEVAVTVRDRGIGIPEWEQERIFERFYRGSTVGPEIAGTGLGLTLVQHVATAHGGRVAVDSAPGQGAAFSLYFPQAGAA